MFWIIALLLFSLSASLVPLAPVASRFHRYYEPSSSALQVSIDQSERFGLGNHLNECKFCSSNFDSRNALFRHVRTDPSCSTRANGGIPDDRLVTTIRHMLALQFSYWGADCRADLAGDALAEAAKLAIEGYLHDNMNFTNASVQYISSTQSSVTKMRHRALSQEDGCAASGDVMILSVQAPAAISAMASSNSQHRNFLKELIIRTNSGLVNRSQCDDIQIRLDACKYLTPDSRLHAERSCTQLVYHYLLPLRWLPDGLQLERWWLDHEIQDANGHNNRASRRPPTESLRFMKDALRSGESAQLPLLSEGNAQDPLIKVASGRFGALATKERRPWHNFADPNLKGDASPNNEPVWVALDRARMVQFLRHEQPGKENDEVVALLEFRGDAFLLQQVRRIVGTAVAVAHGWLPTDVFAVSTTSGSFMETPVAPDGRLYLAESKFHFDELRTDGKSLFESDAMGTSERSNYFLVANGLIAKELLQNRNEHKESESVWLKDLEINVAPRIRAQLLLKEMAAQNLVDTAVITNVETPTIYLRVLELLRTIIANDSWPETSAARSSVITNVTGKRQLEKQREITKKGSFTVVNPNFRDGLYKNGIAGDALPLGNTLFPDLVNAVFQLELALSETRFDPTLCPKRPASSHCAINANAQFAPHVDSGRGAGQSLSMIVGLGDYNGGELAVEGDYYDIRYKPLQFDGWKLRHWTNPFAGERFSLVWFTPEQKD